MAVLVVVFPESSSLLQPMSTTRSTRNARGEVVIDPDPIDRGDAQNFDSIDAMVFSATLAVRRDYYNLCHRLGQKPRELSPVVIGMRSVTP